MSISAIKAALETRLVAMTGGLGLANTQFEGLNFEPVGGTPYQRAWLMPAEPFNYGGLSTAKRYQGIFQIDLCYPYGPGAGDAQAMADAVAAWFPQGLSVSANSVTTRVAKTPEIKSGRVEGDRWVIPVRVSWFANV